MARRTVAEAGPHPVDVTVGLRLREIRRRKGISQAAVASALGLSFQQVQKYEKGANRVSASALVQIAKVLDVAPRELLGQYEQSGSPAFDWSGFTPEIQQLIEGFGRLSPELQRAAARAIAELSKAEGRSDEA